MNNNKYLELKSLLKKENISLINIIAPARSSSTALERALSQLDKVSIQINDPWSIYDDADRELKTYEYIIDKISSNLDQIRNTYILIKDVADYIPPLDSWKRYENLSNKIIFLIRNPLLTNESMMKIMPLSIDENHIFPGIGTVNEYAKAKGFDSWKIMQQNVNDSRDYRHYEDLFMKLYPEEKRVHDMELMRIPLVKFPPKGIEKRLGFSSLDEFAVSIGFENWYKVEIAYINKSINNSLLDKVFHEIFLNRINGWEAMYQHYQITDKNKVMVIDSTMYRAMPSKVLRLISQWLELTYSNNLYEWSNSHKKFDTDYSDSVPYYEKVSKSLGLNPPVENVIPLEKFPGFVSKNMLDPGGLFEIYLSMFNDITSTSNIDMNPKEYANLIFSDKSLEEIDPVFTYIMYYINGNNSVLNDLKNKYNTFGEIFDFIT